MRLLFCSDMHGNLMQYSKILQHAAGSGFDALVLGGDLCPKGIGGEMQHQREFFETYLIPRLREFKLQNPHIRIFLMLGNDDWAGNLYMLADHEGEIFDILGDDDFDLGDGFKIVGYPYVPITPFRIKDWEKWDLADRGRREKIELEKDIHVKGFRSWNMHYEGFEFHLNDEPSIEKDMERLFKRTKPAKTVYVFHSPPYNTNLDMTYSGDHVGSLSIRMAIEKHHPFLTLHGHIHESVEMSKEYTDRLGKTMCACTGNRSGQVNAAVLEIELPLGNVNRVLLE